MNLLSAVCLHITRLPQGSELFKLREASYYHIELLIMAPNRQKVVLDHKQTELLLRLQQKLGQDLFNRQRNLQSK